MSTGQENRPAGRRPSVNPWLAAAAVLAPTFMEVLDSTVVNVSLPHIAGNLSASTEEATWVLTSYLVSNAVVLPITGWLSIYFGRKSFLLSCIAVFTAASLLCGAAPSLELLITARIIQGIGGGALQPISQAVLLESFPREKRGVAMAAFGIGVVVAPIIGPTLGGWITDNYSWRWIFYINLPIGIAAVAMVRAFVFDPPYVQRDRSRPVDYIGFGLLAIWVGCLQIMVDKGQQEDWFASNYIAGLFAIVVIGLAAFLVWELRTKSPIVDLRVFRNLNFATGTVLMTLVGVVLYGTTALLPLFLQTLLGYTAVESGLAMSPRGIGSVFGMVLVGRLIQKLQPQLLTVAGFSVLGASTLALSVLTLEVSTWQITWPNVLSGVGMAFVFVPLTSVTMGTLKNEQLGNATGIFNLMRNLGGSIGIAMMTTLLARNAQTYQVFLGAHASAFNPAFRQAHEQALALLAPQVGPSAAAQLAPALIYRTVVQQASLLAFIADFRLLGLLCFLALPTVFIFRKVEAKRPPAAH